MSHKVLIGAALLAAVVLGFAWLGLSAPATQNQPGGSIASSTITGSSGSSYTLADVATHGNVTSCWSAINGKVYDLTTWINQHPGGQQRILSICGTDGSSAFNAQHSGQARPANELTNLYIGSLTQ